MPGTDHNPPRTVEVRFFASLVELVGANRVRLEVQPTDTIEELWAALAGRYPGLNDLPFRPLVACDLDYATWDRNLEGVSEVAFLPPVSGG